MNLVKKIIVNQPLKTIQIKFEIKVCVNSRQGCKDGIVSHPVQQRQPITTIMYVYAPICRLGNNSRLKHDSLIRHNTIDTDILILKSIYHFTFPRRLLFGATYKVKSHTTQYAMKCYGKVKYHVVHD